MARFSKDFTRQAKYGMILSIVSTLGAAILLVLIGRNLTLADWSIIYGNKTYGMVVYLVGMGTLATAIAGFWLSLGSWGEQRNERQRWSSIGFFVGAIAISLTAIMLVFFSFRAQLVG